MILLIMGSAACFVVALDRRGRKRGGVTGPGAGNRNLRARLLLVYAAGFDRLDSAILTAAGYTGGDVENPSYNQACSGPGTSKQSGLNSIGPESLFPTCSDYFRNIDPTQADAQFADRRHQHRTVIFYHNEE